MLRLGAERDANADLARALRRVVRDHAVEADRREQNRETGEDAHRDRVHLVRPVVCVLLLRDRLKVEHRQVGIDGTHGRAHRRDASVSGSSCERGRAASRGRPSLRRAARTRSCVMLARDAHVADDADDREPGQAVRRAELDSPPDRRLPRPQLLGQLLVDHHDGLSTRRDPAR